MGARRCKVLFNVAYIVFLLSCSSQELSAHSKYVPMHVELISFNSVTKKVGKQSNIIYSAHLLRRIDDGVLQPTVTAQLSVC